MKNKSTTIKINIETKQRIDKLKEYDRETYDEVIRKLLFILNTMKKEPEKAQKILEKIDSSIKRKEKYNKVYSSEKKDKVEKSKREKGMTNEKLKIEVKRDSKK